MATIKSDLVVKAVRHRGLYEGKGQSLMGRVRLNAGDSVGTSDILHMVPLGENVRPSRIILSYKEVSGTPAITGGDFDIGVAPLLPGVTVKRGDGTEFPPLTASGTLYSSNADLNDGAAVQVAVTPTVAPSGNTKWGPFLVTLTPNETTSVAGGAIDLNLYVEFEGEKEEVLPPYDAFLVNGGKYKNA